MVKLFVGGLPEGVDSIRLRQLFSQFVLVNECDVIKDYAFVVSLFFCFVLYFVFFFLISGIDHSLVFSPVTLSNKW